MSKRFRVCPALAIVAVACMITLALLLVVAGAEAAPSPLTEKVATEMRSSIPEGVDLDVTFISRTPLYRAYCVEYLYDAPNQPGRPVLCPGTENDRRWPEPGEIVTFTAHIINKGTMTSPAFDYAWHIDGVEVDSGTLPELDPAAEVTAIYPWPWAHTLSPEGQRALGEHTVRFTADPADAIAETYEGNNHLEDRTEAMSFRISITPEMYEVYSIPVDPKYPYSAEDWLQKQIAAGAGDGQRSLGGIRAVNRLLDPDPALPGGHRRLSQPGVRILHRGHRPSLLYARPPGSRPAMQPHSEHPGQPVAGAVWRPGCAGASGWLCLGRAGVLRAV